MGNLDKYIGNIGKKMQNKDKQNKTETQHRNQN